MKLPNRIKSARWLGDYRLKLTFKDGFIGEVDLRPIVEAPRGQIEEPLRDLSFFQRVQCDGFTVAWPNDYDLCPDVLRYWCEIGRVCSEEEMSAAFAELLKPTETSASVLNDKPPAP
jgi:hypothetical protein